jgi:L-ascorbate metabolism protein UlaG (beta-lactamase superfamily)
MTGTVKERQYQRAATPVIPMTNNDFGANCETAVYWMSSACIFINSHGTTILIDPVFAVLSENPSISEYLNMELISFSPVASSDINQLDAILYTHADEDHLGEKTAIDLLHTGAMYHTTPYTCKKLKELGVPQERIIEHTPLDEFEIGSVNIKMTYANHPWTFGVPERFSEAYRLEDCCGFKLSTQDGIIWDPGDSLLLGNHLDNKDVDLMFVDYGDDTIDPTPVYHIGRKDAIVLSNYLNQADLIPFHWGTYYGPELSWCGCDPEDVRDQLINPERLKILYPGEKYILHEKNKHL